MVDAAFVQRQLDAAYGALTAAQAAIEALARELARSEPEAPVQPAEGRCEHRRAEPASTMGGTLRMYCRDCMSWVYPDGRVEPMEDPP